MLITSFIPLWLSILFVVYVDIRPLDGTTLLEFLKDKNVSVWFSIFIAFFLILSTTYVVWFLLNSRKSSRVGGSGKITSARKSATLATDFLLTYIMPLIAFDFTRARDVALFLLYFVLIAFLNIRNGNVYTNILFEFTGYRIFICDIEKNVAGKPYKFSECVVISKENLAGKIGQEFSYFDFNNDTYLNLNTSKERR